jgi:hypothetical protein
MTQPPTGEDPLGDQPPATGRPEPGHAGPGHFPPGHPASRKRRGALIAAISLAVVLLLCAGGGLSAFLLLRDAEAGEGAPEPVAAVEAFLRAVYTDRDPAGATALVCREARDQAAIERKIEEVENYATIHQNPRFRWEPPIVDDQNEETATVTTKVIMTTSDEKVSEHDLRFTVVRETGWWVCEVG